MKEKLGRVLAWLSALAALVLIALALDWIPSRVAELPTETRFDPKALVDEASKSSRSEPARAKDAGPPAPREPLTAWSFPVCDAPEKGARVFSVPLGGAQALFIWCKGGFVRVDVSLHGEVPQAQKVARFPSRAELPGGVTAQDFDADGVLDLVLATAPPAQVLHRPGAGVFLLRGRQAGGYEAARALVETPVSAVAALPPEAGRGADLLVLTRGDLSAQRPGELWLFSGGTNLVRTAQQPLGLAPRDLVLARIGAGSERTVWSALPQAGRIHGVQLSSSGGRHGLGATHTVAFPGVQGVIAATSAEPSSVLLARNAQDIRRVGWENEQLSLSVWAEQVNVGPGVLADLDGDSGLEVLAVVDGGVVRVLGPSLTPPEELPLASSTVLDVATLRDDALRERAVAIVRGAETTTLSLIVLPKPPWLESSQLVVRPLEVSDLPGQAVVALE